MNTSIPGTDTKRPEIDKANTEHRIYAIDPDRAEALLNEMSLKGLLHRAAFVAAVSDRGRLFCDYRQTPAEIPIPDFSYITASILEDKVGHTSRGPNFFHQESLARLILRMDFVTIYSAAASKPDARVYGLAVLNTAKRGKNSLLIETTPNHEREWYAFVKRVSARTSIGVTIVSTNPPSAMTQRTPQDDISDTPGDPN